MTFEPINERDAVTHTTRHADTASDLRIWAGGIYGLQAGVELLLRAYGGRFAQPGYGWIQWSEENQRIEDPGNWYLETDELTNNGALSGGEQRLLNIVASLCDVHPMDLSDVAGLDRAILSLVLAAVAHAGGSHEQSELVWDAAGHGQHVLLGSLYPWPN